MTKVTRTLKTTKAKYSFIEVTEKGPSMLEGVVTLPGVVPVLKAEKMVSKLIGKPCAVTDLYVENVMYEMPIEVFLEHATKAKKNEVTEDEING